MFRIFANNVNPAATTDIFTFFTHEFDTGSDFHFISFYT